MAPELMGVAEAARELNVDPSRVRSLISNGLLRAEKISGRWLLDGSSVRARRRAPVPPGRPLAARNAWALLLDASGDESPARVDSVASWRMRRALEHPGLSAMRPRLERRAVERRFWALPGELPALRDEDDAVLSGSSAAGELGLDLVAPDTVDAYVPSSRVQQLVRSHALQEAPLVEANVTLRAVPDDAWMLAGRNVAPEAAVALDLASYPDPRSSRVGLQLLRRYEHGLQRRN